MGDVKEFSNELNSLYNVKPPISRAKMTSITRLALKSLKHYKHVVQSIEKFIHKCQAEYKLPGLYVIDSIVRQSRHQFGADKDPFAGRFSRNIAVTFHDLLSCPAQEICKIVRVLNLWQKNNMFPSQIIQPLLDMAANPNSQEVYMEAQKAIQQVTGLQPSSSVQQHTQIKSFSELPSTSDVSGELNSQSADLLKALSSQLLLPLFTNPQLYLQLLQQQLLVQQATTGNLMPELQHPFMPQIDSNLMAQIQALTAALMARVGTPQQQPQTNQQASNTTTMANAGITSNLDTTTDSLQSSDFHGDFTSPIFCNKKAGLSDIVSDIEDDKVIDQMSISSISTPAINTTEVPDGGLGSGAGPAYSPSTDHPDNGQLVTSSTHHVILSEPCSNAILATDSSLLPSCAPSVHPETSTASKSSMLNSYNTENVHASKIHKNDYTLFSPVSPINSVPNSPSEESGTPVLDEIPSPKNFQGNCLMIDEEEKKSMVIEEGAVDNVGQFHSNDMEVLDELQTPEEGEILANETEAGELDYIDYSATRDRRKRKRSKRSKDKREKSKVGNSNRRPETSTKYPESKVESLLKARKETKVMLGKKDKESKKKRKRHKERTSMSGGRADLGKISRRSSTSMADQTLVVEDEPRRYFVVLDELPEPARHDLKKSKRKRSRSPELTSTYSSARMSRKDLFVTRENAERVHDRQDQKRHRVESKDDMVKDKKRRHSKEELHGKDKPKKVSLSIDRALSNPPSLVISNGPSSHHHTSTSRKDRSKSSRNRSPKKDSKNKSSKDKSHEPVKAAKTVVKNRIYRAKSISAEPVPSKDRKSRSRSKGRKSRSKSKEKKSARKGSNHKSSKHSPVKQREVSSSRNKEDKSKSSHKSEGLKGSKNDRSKMEKDKDEKKQSKSSTSSSSGGDKDEASKKEKCLFPPVKDNHACVCSTTLWIGPIGRHTKKDELKKELNKYSKPTLIDVVTKQSCVHVAFETRKEAVDLMNFLNGTILCGKTVKVTWAPGSGIKQSKFLKRWDVESGATYIPWDKLPFNMEAITQGGVLDTNSMPPSVVSATAVLPESKEKENSTKKSSSSIGLISLNLNVENEHDKASRKKPGEGNEFSLSEILLPLEVSNKESVKNEILPGQDKKELNVKETTEDDLSSISLPPLPPHSVIEPIIGKSLPVIAKQVQGSSIESEIIVVQDDLTEDLDSSHINKVLEVETLHSPLIQKADDAKEELEKESNKSIIANKFSFSIDNHNCNPEKLDTLKKRSDIESEIESNSATKVSELRAADDLQNSENVTAKISLPTDKKASKICKPEILKGKIKFGVISAFSGWANKQKLSATTQPVTTSTEEKQKDARILYETLMERISSKTSKADQKSELSSMAVTFDEDFLSTIKVPSPKSTFMEASKVDENKSRSMSEVYDPFENYSDSGDNSPENKVNTSSHNSQVPIMGLSHPPMFNSSQSLIFSQNFGLHQGSCLSPANNVSLPPTRLNTPLNCLPAPTQGIAPVASFPMAMPLSNNLILPPSNTSIPNSSSALIGSNHPANSLLPPPGFMPQQSHQHLPITQNPIITPTTIRQAVINTTFPSMTSSRVPSFNQTQSSFNLPPPVISLNRLASSSFPPLPNNSKHLPATSSMTFPHLQSAAYPSMGFPNTANLPLNHSVSSALGVHIHRRPPLLSEPPANPEPKMSANVPPVHIWTSGLPNPPTTQALQNSCTSGSTLGINSSQSVQSLRPTDWFRNSAPGATASQMAPLLPSHSTSFAMKPRSHFITNTQAPIQVGYNQIHLDYSNKDSSMIGNHPWQQPSNNTSHYGGDVSRQCSKLPIMGKANIDKTTSTSSTGSISISDHVDMKSDMLKYMETSSNMSNADRSIDYHILPKSGAVDEDGEPIFKIESVVSNTKLQSEVGNKSSNLVKPFSESLANQERLPAPPAFFNVPPPAAPPQQIKGSISTIMTSQGPPTSSVSILMGVRAPHGIAQEFSKLLNSPVTFDGFSKNMPPRDQVRMVGNANLNPNFVQRPASCNNNSLLGPPPPNNNFNPLNKTSHLPSVAPSLPNEFNRNLPPPLLPQQMGMRNMLVPGPVDRSNKNSEMRFPQPPLLNPSDFVNSLQPNVRHESLQRQARFVDRDHERRSADRQEGGGPRFPRKPFNHSREQKYRFRNESSRFYVRGGSSHYN